MIISDGLRYECAKELLSVLHSDPKHQAEISFMLSSLPSNTRMGMSALLPHSELQLKEEFISINNISTKEWRIEKRFFRLLKKIPER